VKRKRKLLGVLGQNEQISFNAATEVFTKKLVHTDTVVAWKNDELYFDDISFSEAAVILSNKFNVTITFTEERIRNCQFTAAFKNDATLEQVLAVLSQLNNVTYRMEENNITISGTGCE
jgi:ferric-dicitrate binding protein FerR (iron transport regulator)